MKRSQSDASVATTSGWWWKVVWCGVVWCGVAWCGVVGCGVVWCGVVWCGEVGCGVVWCGGVWCGVVWRGVAWCGVAWCGVVWCGVVVWWGMNQFQWWRSTHLPIYSYTQTTHPSTYSFIKPLTHPPIHLTQFCVR